MQIARDQNCKLRISVHQLDLHLKSGAYRIVYGRGNYFQKRRCTAEKLAVARRWPLSRRIVQFFRKKISSH